MNLIPYSQFFARDAIKLRKILKDNNISTRTFKIPYNPISSENILLGLWLSLNRKCYLCKNSLKRDKITKDHVFPKKFGYSLWRNCMPSCHRCNETKGSKAPTAQQVLLCCNTYENIGLKFYPTKYADVVLHN